MCEFCEISMLWTRRFYFQSYASFQLTHCCMCHSPVFCDLINSCLFASTSCQNSRHFNFALLQCLPIQKGLQYFFHQDDNTALLQPNILINMISSDHTAYCMGFCFRCHCTHRKQRFFKGFHNLIIKRVHRLLLL